MQKLNHTASEYVYTHTGFQRPVFENDDGCMVISLEYGFPVGCRFYLYESHASRTSIEQGLRKLVLKGEIKTGEVFISDATAVQLRIVQVDVEPHFGFCSLHVWSSKEFDEE